MHEHTIDVALAHIRTLFTAAELPTVQPYAGEFAGDDLAELTLRCPAVLVTALGWQPAAVGSTRLSGRHVSRMRLAAFVVTKHADRQTRSRQAMQIASRLSVGLRAWVPDAGQRPVSIAPLDASPRAENLHGRAVDKKGLALWLVQWDQCVRPEVDVATQDQLVDLIAVEMHDQVGPATTVDETRPQVDVSAEITFLAVDIDGATPPAA